MKDKVIQFFKNLPKTKEEQFNEALTLYRQCPHKNAGQERFYNRAGYTAANLENLHYDLKKLVGVTEADIRKAKTIIILEKTRFVLVIDSNTNLKELTTDVLENYLKDNKVEILTLPNFEKGIPGNSQMKKYCKENEIETVSGKSEDLILAINSFYRANLEALVKDFLHAASELDKALNSEGFKNVTDTNDLDIKVATEAKKNEVGATSKEEVFTKAPDEVKEAVKFKDEFPFLLESDCPEEFHILTGKKFASYYAWVKAHQHLLVNIVDTDQDASPINLTDTEVDELAVASVENFEVNDLIWKELNYYKETGKVLGKHPIFIERKLKESIDAMPVADAAKRLTNLDNYIRRDNNNLKAAEEDKNEANIEKYTQKVLEWQTETKLIKAKHNL
jgi:hypothetical protein